MYTKKADILFLLKVATELLKDNKDNFPLRYYKDIFRAFKRFNKTGEHFYYKVRLSDIDLEKLGLFYLFYQNDLNLLEPAFEVVRFGDIFPEHTLFYDFKRSSTFDNLILFERVLDYDTIHNIVYLNKRQLKFLSDILERNKIKWFSINDSERNIIKKGSFSLRYIKKINKPVFNTPEDVKSITLKDVLSVVPLKYFDFEEWRNTNALKIDDIMICYYDHIFLNPDLKVEFIHHMRKILTPLFDDDNSLDSADVNISEYWYY